MAAVKNNPKLEQAIEDWISTYTALTAKGLLERLGLKISDTVLPQQLHDTNSFYRKLLKLPAMNAFNELIRVQCRDIQLVSQQKLVDYILSGEGEKPASDPGFEARQKVEQERLSLIETGKKFDAIEDQHFKNVEDTDAYLKEQVVKWNALIDEITDKAWDLLKENGINLHQRYKQRLRELFNEQGAGADPSPEILKGLKIKDKPSPWAKALIKLFLEVEKNG